MKCYLILLAALLTLGGFASNARAGDLSIDEFTADVSSVSPGEVFKYSLDFSNCGWHLLYCDWNDLHDVFLRVTLNDGLELLGWEILNPHSPMSLVYVGAVDNIHVWYEDVMHLFEIWEIDITVQLDSLYTGGNIDTTVMIMTIDPEDYFDNNSATLILPVNRNVPEPTTLALVGLGLVGLGVVGLGVRSGKLTSP